MRIGLNLLYLLPGVVGGTETYARSLLQALSQIDKQNEYIVFLNRELAALELPMQSNFKRVVCPVLARSRSLRYSWEQFVLPFQTRRYRLDLLHSLGYVQPLKLPCKSVVTIHDLNFSNIGYLMSTIKRATLRYFVTRSAKAADHIITVSEFSKRQIGNVLSVPSEKMTVTYNAVKDRPANIVNLEELRKRYSVRQPYILGLSSPSPHKNISNLVKSFTLLRRQGFEELKLVLGGHRPHDSGKLDRAIQNSEFRNDINFTGYVPDTALAGLYSHAAAFVFPSTYEGFGIPILEAFSYGAPVICSRVAALPEVAGDAACYFNPVISEEMAVAISSVLADEELRKELTNRGKARVQLFSWEKTAEKTLAVYQKLIEGS